jgi:hypothetical protein
MIMIAINADAKRRNDESELHANLAAYQAWRLAFLMRVKKLPQKPDDLMSKKGQRRAGSGSDWKAQKAMIETINAMFGGFDNRVKTKEG